MSTATNRPSTAFEVLEAEYHSGEPCDCYPPDRDRPRRECAAWADNIIVALRKGGYVVVEALDVEA
jgi:proteasome lid subunit RPN8/RPN11